MRCPFRVVHSSLVQTSERGVKSPVGCAGQSLSLPHIEAATLGAGASTCPDRPEKDKNTMTSAGRRLTSDEPGGLASRPPT